MNQGHLEEELLNRYFDGDLRAPQLAAVKQHLDGCAECSGRHRELASLRSMVELAAEESARGVDFDAVYGRIERGVRESATPSLGERFGVWWRDLAEHRPGQLWVPVAGALAAAIVLIFVLRGDRERDARPEAERQPGADPAQEQATPEQESARAAPRAHEIERLATATVSSEVEQVDFGGNAGTVFEIALADGVSTPVVWINDDVQ